MRFDRDVPVTMSDGARLMTNVLRPEPDGRYPVVMSVTPYGKHRRNDSETLGVHLARRRHDLFVALRKFDPLGNEVVFYGYNGFARDGVAKGWLRVSHRELDDERSRPGRPWHTHRQRQPVRPDEIVPVEIEILASSTYFEAGAVLQLDVLGHDAAKYPAFKHGRTVNAGEHSIHAGGRYPAMLLTPFSRGGWMPARSA